ncbi:hypothetical protein [Gordonia soli]|uniref:Uncharacterized protein n=1 Tax=Gordonia soli NBRC 108243 TaxID=1223545 RepID=M0QE04_9ACTN|nr:hypothetical protein [Gordonia soli]GAC66556.1 hypothetical protein GS4_03_00030 [Gordonia soli NBRC 108243]
MSDPTQPPGETPRPDDPTPPTRNIRPSAGSVPPPDETPTGEIPTVTDAAADDQHTDPPRRDWRHLWRTRIRTSTFILVVAFVGMLALYGYTSERYGVVEPPQRPTPVRTTPTPTETWTPSSTSPTSTSSSSSSPSVPSTSDESGAGGATGEPDVGDQGPQTGSRSTPTTVPGLPGVPLPNLGLPYPSETSTPRR